MWCLVSSTDPSYLVISSIMIFMDWTATVSIQFLQKTTKKSHWKQVAMPKYLTFYFSNNFKNPVGISGICGLFFAPLCYYWQILHPIWFQDTTCAGYYLWWWLTLGCAVSVCGQSYFITTYLHCLLQQDNDIKKKSKE